MKFNDAGPLMTELLKKCASNDVQVARAARHQLAKALTTPLRQSVLEGDIATDIFSREVLTPGVSSEWPLDFLSPGSQKNHIAYTVPSQGRIPERHVEGDFLVIPTYEIASSIDFNIKYARDARWNVVSRALEVLESDFVRKINQDAWRVLLAAGYGRSLVVYDDAVPAGFLSKRLVELMKNIMRRNSSGNSTSTNRGKMTRLYVSPESIGDVRSWDLTQVDDVTRRDIFMSDEEGLSRIFGVELRTLDELGVGQEFQTYYATLGGTMPSYTYAAATVSKVEICVAVDMSANDSFVMPVREPVQIFEDETFHRQRRMSWYGWAEHGFAVLDSRRVLLGAI